MVILKRGKNLEIRAYKVQTREQAEEEFNLGYAQRVPRPTGSSGKDIVAWNRAREKEFNLLRANPKPVIEWIERDFSSKSILIYPMLSESFEYAKYGGKKK